jgi:hypothetical protein
MDLTTFMIAVFCLIDDVLAGKRLRKRGPFPTLRDSEVLTIEVVGEFLGLDTESSIFTHFCRYYADWFPGLRQVNRTTCYPPGGRSVKIKQDLWQEIQPTDPARPVPFDRGQLSVPVCRFARAKWCRTFGEVAAFGYDEVARQTYYGLRAHVRLAWPGVLVDCTLAPAHIHDTAWG